MFIMFYIEACIRLHMEETRQDGQFYEDGGVEYLYHDGKAIEIACSYPDIETGLAALKKSVE